jgi:hypothetical protein
LLFMTSGTGTTMSGSSSDTDTKTPGSGQEAGGFQRGGRRVIQSTTCPGNRGCFSSAQRTPKVRKARAYLRSFSPATRREWAGFCAEVFLPAGEFGETSAFGPHSEREFRTTRVMLMVGKSQAEWVARGLRGDGKSAPQSGEAVKRANRQKSADSVRDSVTRKHGDRIAR